MIKTVGKDQDIKITDQLRFEITTTDSSGCLHTPYKVNKITIYFVSRDFTDTTASEYTNVIYDKSKKEKYEKLKTEVCSNPTDDNLSKLKSLKLDLENSKTTSSFFFKEANPIKIFGGYVDKNGELFPAWLNPDLVPEEVSKKVNSENSLSEISEGKFTLDWVPIGLREGDYFICWDWTPNLAGNSLSAHMPFRLLGDPKLNNSIPTHYTKENKYEILLEKYLPDMFKNFISDGDLTPFVLQELNGSAAKGFTFIEDLANQIIDLLDSNSIQEQMLPLLSNLFNLKLKSNDPILWRRQIKKAIPNFKKKGTIGGLRTVLGDAGIQLLRVGKLWQVLSKYTYQECFVVKDSNVFLLSKNIITPIDENNFEVYYRSKDSFNWISLSSEYASIEQDGTDYYLIWQGHQISEEPVRIHSGDSVRVLYQYKEMPNQQEQNLENYIRNLDLFDQRDERKQEYPPKNWNTKLIDEEDPLFDLIIPIRHPIQEPIVWGKVRTEFPYSENIYNMEEYNGSVRDSFKPCDIDKKFIDPCSQCQSAKLNIDLEIENLSNDRIFESKQIIEEFVPFHSIIHSINFLGSINEFIKSPLEEVSILVSIFGQENLVSGEAQHIFNRSIIRNYQLRDSDGELVYDENGDPVYQGFQNIKRNLLSQMTDRTSGGGQGIGRNNYIYLYSPSLSSLNDLENSDFKNKSTKFDKNNINVGELNLSPLNNSNLLEILNHYHAGLYSVSNVSEGSFKIVGEVLEPLDKSQFEYRISNKIYSQSEVNISEDGLVDLNPGNSNLQIDDIRNYAKIGDYLFYDSNQYKIKKFIESEPYKFYIDNYQSSNVGGIEITIYRRIVENCLGQLDYQGLTLDTSPINYETYLPIQNGKNEQLIKTRVGEFKENYLISINSQYYSILDIDGTIISLAGPNSDWTIAGDSVEFSVYQFVPQELIISEQKYPPNPGHTFSQMNHSNNEVITNRIESGSSLIASVLNSGTQYLENSEQQEKINFKIEYKDGTIEEKET
jgi:hypothetical protein